MKLNRTKCLLQVFSNLEAVAARPQTPGPGGRSGSSKWFSRHHLPSACALCAEKKLKSVQMVLPAFGSSSRATRWHWVHSHCNRQPPSHCSELMVIKQDSAFGVGDRISLNKLFLFHLVIPNWTRKLEFWGGWPKTELWILSSLSPYKNALCKEKTTGSIPLNA